MTTPEQWRAAREDAAAAYKPKQVKLLLLGEAPPSSPDRYFYFPTVASHDSLFRYVARLVLEREPTRQNKRELLAMLRDSGVYLIDVSPDPIIDVAELRPLVRSAVQRAAELSPDHIIIVKVAVWDLMYWPLREAGLPVVEQAVPFPGSGQQRRFEESMAKALASIGWVAPG